MKPDSENRAKLFEAEKLISEVENDIMPPSVARAELHAARKMILMVVARGF